MAGVRKDPGPTAQRVAANLRRIRHGERDVTTAELSRRLTEIGQPVPDTGITKTEKGDRRVDADDLVALALALGVTPNTLLMPQVDYLGGAGRHHLTPEVRGTAEELWQWAQGEMPLPVPVPGAQAWLGTDGYPLQEFAVRSRPYLTAPRPPATEQDAERDAALREVTSAVAKAMHAGAGAAGIRRAVELTIALPVIAVTPEFRERFRKPGRAGGGES